MTRMDTTKFIAEVNILKSRPCLNLWSRWSPWRPCWWVPPVPGVCSFHHGRCCFSTNCSNWQSSAQSLLQIWRYYLDIYIESYLYLYVHARFQNSIWAVLKTSWESILITWSFAKTFRHSFANLVFSFAGMNFAKTSFASFRGGRCHLKKKSLQFEEERICL